MRVLLEARVERAADREKALDHLGHRALGFGHDLAIYPEAQASRRRSPPRHGPSRPREGILSAARRRAQPDFGLPPAVQAEEKPLLREIDDRRRVAGRRGKREPGVEVAHHQPVRQDEVGIGLRLGIRRVGGDEAVLVERHPATREAARLRGSRRARAARASGEGEVVGREEEVGPVLAVDDMRPLELRVHAHRDDDRAARAPSRPRRSSSRGRRRRCRARDAGGVAVKRMCSRPSRDRPCIPGRGSRRPPPRRGRSRSCRRAEAVGLGDDLVLAEVAEGDAVVGRRDRGRHHREALLGQGRPAASLWIEMAPRACRRRCSARRAAHGGVVEGHLLRLGVVEGRAGPLPRAEPLLALEDRAAGPPVAVAGVPVAPGREGEELPAGLLDLVHSELRPTLTTQPSISATEPSRLRIGQASQT
jgi:hypothetical protein